MSLPTQNIEWNRLYAAQPQKRRFAEMRIQQHFTRMRLARRGVLFASVRYSLLYLPLFFIADQFLQTYGLAWVQEGRPHHRRLSPIPNTHHDTPYFSPRLGLMIFRVVVGLVLVAAPTEKVK